MYTGYDFTEDTTRSVLEVDQLNFGDQNVLPSAWFDHLRTPESKAYMVAILVLSEIVYWISPLKFRDSDTGQVVIRKRFKGDTWQMKYSQVADRFGVSKRQVQRAVAYLIDQGLITRELRTVITEKGQKLGNVVFVDLNVGRLAEISQDPPPIANSGNRGLSPTLAIAIANSGETNTDLSTTDLSTNKKIPEAVPAQVPSEASKKAMVKKKEPEDTQEGGKGESRAEKGRSPHQELMRLYDEALGYPIPNGGKEAAAAKKILVKYSANDAIGCYHFMKSGSFWSDKHLSLQSVYEQIGPWIQAGRPKEKRRSNGRSAPAKLTIEEANRANKRAMEKLNKLRQQI